MDNKEQCRAEFEAWAEREGYAIEGEYPYPVDLMHKAWHAAWHRHAVAELAAIAKAATSPAPAVVLSQEVVQKGMMALLQCCASELEDYSETLYAGYEADVRVAEAILSSA